MLFYGSLKLSQIFFLSLKKNFFIKKGKLNNIKHHLRTEIPERPHLYRGMKDMFQSKLWYGNSLLSFTQTTTIPQKH